VKSDLCVLMRGAGEMATGVAHRLFMSNLQVVLVEIPKPLAVRRAVSFCEAVYDGRKTVEGVDAVLASSLEDAEDIRQTGAVPLLVDPELTLLEKLKPDVLVEATLSKGALRLSADMAPLVIGLGPGLEAPDDARFIIETNRGHHLGRIIEQGMAQANTGIPGDIAGKTWERVLRAPTDGVFETDCKLGDKVKAGQEVGRVAGKPVMTRLDGVLRGLIRPGAEVSNELKLGDVDPRGQLEYLDTISEKARALGGSVLEAILRVYNK
jgi:xanthine dehydrogenase accessory factor